MDTKQWKCVPLVWSNVKRANVCKYCGSETESVYIATSHDHTDDRADMCSCGEGEDFEKFFAQVHNPIHKLSDYIMERK